MPEETPSADRPPEHLEVRRETTDASFRAILFILLGTMVLAAFIHIAIWGFFVHRREAQDRTKASPFPLAPGPSTALPAEPRLEQIDRVAGVEKVNVYERQEVREDELNAPAGLTAGETGFAHVPLDRVFEYFDKEKSLPSRTETPGDRPWRGGGLVDGGESNSGREFRGKPR